MQLRDKIERLAEEMLDGHILLHEAIGEFEKLYILAAVKRHNGHLSKTADSIGIHRNTLTKRMTEYKPAAKARTLSKKKKA